ncbi:YjbH domain-containing protein [Celeribacter indicus]|uniref:Lipoprotein n=1 Tax=Celeribacter indicus TaxID=1208324 RepID=A0A0B5DYX5_9RHOB|nr:YjbH domain-containing protein [Celeribacter indicus]AJE45432.1 hypothetical protein P73_0717 [Celeribacter indicus]SDX01833.1 Exopolysaccharide biosynthesis protein YbjH [Celeribacter indicus]
MSAPHALLGVCVLTALGLAPPALAQDVRLSFPVSTFGTPGLIDMPSGEVFEDGTLQISTAFHDGSQRYTMSFQITPRLFGSFRYSIIDDLDVTQPTRYDRSFDLGYLLAEETMLRPSVVVGLRDFGGTGVFGSEFVAGTKHFLDDRLAVTAGIGWGRLASHGGFDNPLGILSDRFKTRGGGPDAISDVGQLETDQWFRGDAALFGGIAYQLTPRLTFKAEYSSDAYEREVANAGFEHNTPINVALTYGFRGGGGVSAYALHGSELGILLSVPVDPREARVPGGIEEAPPVLLPRRSAAALSWDEASVRQEDGSLATALAEQGVTLEGYSRRGDIAAVRVANTRYSAETQALGRTARVLANSLPADVERFDIELAARGMPVSRVSLRRADLEALEYDLEGSWRSFARAEIADAAPTRAAGVAGVYPRFNWSLSPYLDPALFDPDDPIRADVGIQAGAFFEPVRGLMLTGIVRQPVAGNLDESRRRSNSVLPHVRSDAVSYAQESDFQIKQFLADYVFRPGPDLYGRVSAGYFETMFGGVSGELLWKPVDSPLALGAEVTYARQRDFDQMFGFRDYDIVTGHASAYYDFGRGYLGQIDVGRYLAGDYGATFSLDREFDNGFRLGAFFTLTDVSSDEFGEGSFDKGIRFSVPIDWISGTPSQAGFGTTIRPVQRDGGARIEMPNRLYELTRDGHANELEDRWGRFWR